MTLIGAFLKSLDALNVPHDVRNIEAHRAGEKDEREDTYGRVAVGHEDDGQHDEGNDEKQR